MMECSNVQILGLLWKTTEAVGRSTHYLQAMQPCTMMLMIYHWKSNFIFQLFPFYFTNKDYNQVSISHELWWNTQISFKL